MQFRVVMLAENASSDQPRPNGPHGSKWAFSIPQDFNRFRLQSWANLKLGEPVSRAPATSVRFQSVSMICESLASSAFIRLMVSTLLVLSGLVLSADWAYAEKA